MSHPTRSIFGASSLVCLIMLVFLITSGVSLGASAGGWSGTGTGGSAASFDLYNPWFLGPEPIPYCFIKSDRIGLSQPALHMMIKKSSEKWKQFFERYKIADSAWKINPIAFPMVLIGPFLCS
ncbi:MAG: hypothetical protein IPK04_11430 [Bdellovibrionales bacterium]|nr:hypothetical protein [Bdellovibrionales bacterium]